MIHDICLGWAEGGVCHRADPQGVIYRRVRDRGHISSDDHASTLCSADHWVEWSPVVEWNHSLPGQPRDP